MYKNIKNILLSIFNITIKIIIHRSCEKSTFFMSKQKKINKKKFLNEKHNERIKHHNSRKKMQDDINNLKFENKN